MGWSLIDLLPGVFVLVVATTAAAASAQWLDPIPGRVQLVHLGLVFAMLGPSLVGGAVLGPLDDLTLRDPFREGSELVPHAVHSYQSDVSNETLPWASATRRAYAHGEWPLWLPNAGAGTPLLANPQAQALQPLQLVALPFPLPRAWGVSAAFKVWLAFAGCFLLLRRQSLGVPAALFGSVVYGLSGFVIHWLGWPHSNTAALLPVVLWAVARVCDERGWIDTTVLAGASAALLLSGHPETVLHAAALTGLYALVRSRPTKQGARSKIAIRLAAAGLVAAGIAAPMLLPATAAVEKSTRAAQVAHRSRRAIEDPARLARIPRLEGSVISRFGPTLAPHAFGENRLGAYWGSAHANSTLSGFAGTVPFLLALLAIVGGRSRRLPQERLFIGMWLVALTTAALPLWLAMVMVRIPVVRSSASFHNRIQMLVVFGTAVLSAYCVERLLRSGRRPTALLPLAVFLAGWLVVAHRVLESPAGPEVLAAWRRGSLAVQLGALALVVIALPRNGRPRIPLLLGVVALELLTFHRPVNHQLSPELFYPATTPIAFLQSQPRTHRMAALGWKTFFPNVGTVVDLYDARLRDPLTPRGYRELSRPLGPGGLIPRRRVFYHLFSVRWLLVSPGTKAGPGYELALEDPNGWVFERAGSLPIVYLPQTVEPLRGEPPVRNQVLRSLRRGAPPEMGVARWAARPDDPSRIEHFELQRSRVTVSLVSSTDRPLATTVYQDGGWRVLADRRPAREQPVYDFFVGGWIPAGTERVDLLYRPTRFLIGSALAALGWCGLGLLAIGPPGTRSGSRLFRRHRGLA